MRLLLLLAFVLAACSDVRTEADDRTADSSPPAELNAIREDRVPEAQRQYFEDGKVTLTEYQTAFGAFAQCASDSGVGDQLREHGRDEVTGLIAYTTQTLLLPPGQSDGTNLNECYHRQFAEVEIAFQISDPAVLARIPEEQMTFFNEELRPCLDQIGVEIPADLEYNDENWLQLNDEAVAALDDGRCAFSGEGG